MPKAALPPLADRSSCASESQGDVVVCAQEENRYRVKDRLPENTLLIDDISDALAVHVGPVTLGSFKKKDGTRGFGVAVTF